MPFLKAGIIGVSGISGTFVFSSTIAHYSTLETVWSYVYDDAIPELSNDDSIKEIWSELRVQLTSKKINDKKLKNIRNLNQKSIKEQEEDLKSWCFKSYKKTQRSIFYDSGENFLNDVKSACIRTIKEKLGSTQMIDLNSEESSKWEKVFEKLKNHNDKTSKTKLDTWLEELKMKLNSKTNLDNWKELRKWCRINQDKGYTGSKSQRWLLVNLYCKE